MGSQDIKFIIILLMAYFGLLYLCGVDAGLEQREAKQQAARLTAYEATK